MKGALLLAAALAACATAPPPDPEPSVRLGETARVGSLDVRPLSVVEDSRCPARADCVWAGRIVVRTEVSSGAAPATHDLILGQPLAIAGERLTLVAAAPLRNVSEAVPPEAYRFAFTFSRR